MRKGRKLNGGFTTIEVVLVLALAGLIFLMAFIALPQLQRSQRDAERKDDMMMFTEAVKKYMTNNRGTLPVAGTNGVVSIEAIDDLQEPTLSQYDDNTWEGFWRDYLGDSIEDPRDGFYNLNVQPCGSGSTGTKCNDSQDQNYGWDTTIHVFTQGVCEEDHAVLGSNPREFAVVYRTESSGVYCFDSSS